MEGQPKLFITLWEHFQHCQHGEGINYVSMLLVTMLAIHLHCVFFILLIGLKLPGTLPRR